MSRFSTKEAATQFYKVLKEAEARPVIISRHRRPRAVVMSISRFRLYEKLVAHLAEDAAVCALADALDKLQAGRLGLAHRALKDVTLFKDASEPLYDQHSGGNAASDRATDRSAGEKTSPSGKIDPNTPPR